MRAAENLQALQDTFQGFIAQDVILRLEHFGSALGKHIPADHQKQLLHSGQTTHARGEDYQV